MAFGMELSVSDLACRRGGRLVFEGLGFRLREGEAAALAVYLPRIGLHRLLHGPL